MLKLKKVESGIAVRRIGMRELDTTDHEDEAENLFLTFQIGTETFAIAIDYVGEIVRLQPIIPVPQQADYWKGVMNLRGDILPVIDLKQRLYGRETQTAARTCIVVVRLGAERTGFLVDNVTEVVDIPEADISPLFDRIAESDGFVCAMARQGETITKVLDCGAVMGQGAFQLNDAALLPAD